MTAVAGSIFTAAQWNTHIRDNLQETEAARALTVSGYSVVSGTNQLVERRAVAAADISSETTQETSYSDLESGAGPSVSLVTGTTVIVSIYSSALTSGGTAHWTSYAVSGATESDANDSWAWQMHITGADFRAGMTHMRSDLEPGLNTFTLKYRVSTSGIGTFNNRRISVIPF